MAKRTPNPRLALTLSPETRWNLSYVALRLGTSKSDLVDGLLSGPLAAMREMLFTVATPLDQLEPDELAHLRSLFASSLDSAIAMNTALREGLEPDLHG